MSDEQKEGTVVSWSSILATFLVSAVQGAAFYGFFLWQRGREKAKNCYDLYEPRQHTLGHRSPPPFSTQESWWRAAWKLSDEETLRCVGLDSYMFLRFLRIGARVCSVGTLLACVLVPAYATGDARGDSTLQFNQLTLARVEPDSNRLWGALLAWYVFTGFCLREFLTEWRRFTVLRYDFLARGDRDIPEEYRYAVRVEQIPPELRSEEKLREYFERLFPGKIQKVVPYLQVGHLNSLVEKRLKHCIAYEKAVAFTEAKPTKPRPQVTVTKGPCPMLGEKRDAIDHHKTEIKDVNEKIDRERAKLLQEPTEPLKKDGSTEDVSSTTAMVLFTSLRAKQAALQCQLTDNIDKLVVIAAPDPRAVIWKNVTTPLPQQRVLSLQAAAFWIVGILFWAVPISFVASISNLASILDTLGVDNVDPNSAWYGLVSGLLPVIALAIFMAVLFMAIVGVATHFIKFKSQSEVDGYALYWHQLFQFANLWLLLFSGSLFNQLDAIVDDPGSVATIIADAMPGAATFFVNMINVGSLGAFGLELSMLPTYGVTLILSMLSPEEARTQRMLDDAQKPPSIVWGQQIPRMVFIFLVSVVYMPIVPVMEVFALIYFSGHYVVWKHQCLHVYAQEYEGGGDATWRNLFGFLLGCLYMGEIIFIAFMGIKEAPTQSALGFVPLALTIIVHAYLVRNVMGPLENLSLEVAAQVDIQDGERGADSAEMSLYAQPSLVDKLEDREPLPYRRDPLGNVVSVRNSEDQDTFEVTAKV